jgi:hypothetical protein
MSATNYTAALKEEAKRVTRRWHAYSTAERRNIHGSERFSDGFFVYLHPELPGLCFPKRFDAAHELLRRAR